VTAGPVNRAELEANYQNPGEIYDDTKTEGAFDVIADQIDDNWADYAAVKAALNSTTLGSSGSQYVKSPTIIGVTGNNVYDQTVSLKGQIDAIVDASIPPGTITYDKLAPEPTATPTASTLPLYDASSRLQTADPASGTDVVNKQHLTSVLTNAAYLQTGSYTGNGAASRDITTTVTPKLIYITGHTDGSNNVSSIALTGSLSAMTVGANVGSSATFTTNLPHQAVPTIISGGFTVTGTTGNGLNVSGRTYTYAIFY
jgi:hypothetical protein